MGPGRGSRGDREKESAMGEEGKSRDSPVQDEAGLPASKHVTLRARLELPREKHPGIELRSRRREALSWADLAGESHSAMESRSPDPATITG